MKKWVTVCLLLLFANSAIAAGVPKELKPRYEGLIEAINNLNFKAYSTYFSENFSFIDAGGMKFNRCAALKLEDNVFKTCRSAKCVFSPIKSKTEGDTITLTFDLMFKAVLTDGTASSMHEVATDTWKKIQGKWLIVKRVDSVMEIKG